MDDIKQIGSNRILIFDTTLRDGEQAPGFSMNGPEKLKMARVLAALRVDVMEAGFAAASPGDEDAICRIASEIEGPAICSLARAKESDIVAAHRALRSAAKKRLHIFLATSPLHRTAKLKMTADEVIEAAIRSVTFARTLFEDVEFSAEDAIRTEPDFLAEVLEAVAEAGATVLNVPDTVGYTTPNEIYKLFTFLQEKVRRPDHVVFSAHCHNDLGLAVANSLTAVQAGARQVEGTINGIGERAGNCSLEELIMVLRTRTDTVGFDTHIDTTQLYPASQMLAEITGNPVQRNKAIVGRNAFAHEAGIHQHGVMNNPETYEIMRPEDVGAPSGGLVLGKHSGKHALAERARMLGYELDDGALNTLFAGFKKMADEKREIDDAVLVSLINEGAGVPSPREKRYAC